MWAIRARMYAMSVAEKLANMLPYSEADLIRYSASSGSLRAKLNKLMMGVLESKSRLHCSGVLWPRAPHAGQEVAWRVYGPTRFGTIRPGVSAMRPFTEAGAAGLIMAGMTEGTYGGRGVVVAGVEVAAWMATVSGGW
jgi:hypothetical protein